MQAGPRMPSLTSTPPSRIEAASSAETRLHGSSAVSSLGSLASWPVALVFGLGHENFGTLGVLFRELTGFEALTMRVDSPEPPSKIAIAATATATAARAMTRMRGLG